MKTITFYSYKGGVGRSLALANIASRLCEFGRKVCLLDFDLEAPGLHFKFPQKETINISTGIVDYIYEFTNSGNLPISIEKYSTLISMDPSKSKVHLIAAGNIDSKEYWRKLSSIDWFDLLYKNENGVAFLLDLKEKIKSQINPDYLLIDSRTGISELSGITLSLLADEIVIVAANNKENLIGSKKIFESITNPKNVISSKPPKVSFVLSRIPFTENPSDRSKEQILLAKIKREYFPNENIDINTIHSDRDLEENEKLKIGYEKDGGTAQISKDYLNLFEQLTKNDFSSDEINKFNDIKKSELLYSKAVASKSPIERINLISQAIILNEKNINFYYFRALEYFKNKDYEKAKNDALILIDSGGILFAYELLGKIYLVSKQYEKSKNIYETLLSHNPNNYQAYMGIGIICSFEGKISESIEYFTKAINAFPEYREAYNGRGNSLRILGKYDEAEADIYKALEIDPNFAMAYCSLAEIKASRGNVQEFYLHFELACSIDSKLVEEILGYEDFYNQYRNDIRFETILEKYNISFPS